MLQERIIIGIDPGTLIMGYGAIQVIGKQLNVLQYGILHLHQCPSHAIKLQKIFKYTLEILDEFIPDEVALEAPFYGKNVQSMLKLGRAQGVAMAAALMREIPITEYAPRKIKQAITGNGNASKGQVASMLMSLLEFKSLPEKLDATDALAVAVCHAYQQQHSSPKLTTWEQFIQQNPARLV
ncbi:MAG: crossover junction endodeoxyribonuclease RuvC [Candidatus Amoebophilus sp. 36-38]|nr:MAG: crossover junction endodeoxyribonuclease RuvC [Candidatus Amoebophilus sp. 36-38]